MYHVRFMKGISIEMVQKMLAPLECETFNQVWPHTCRSTPLYLSSYLGRTELSTALWVYKNYSNMPTKRNTASGSPGKLRFPLYTPFPLYRYDQNIDSISRWSYISRFSASMKFHSTFSSMCICVCEIFKL